jgi:cathepsin L
LDNIGIVILISLPKTGRKCLFKPDDVGATDSGYVDVPEGDEEKLKVAVATQGPVSVAIGQK